MSVVRTDNTFEALRVGDNGWDVCWLGKCIHCNSKLLIDVDGSTDATLEHIRPLCGGGDSTDPENLALACKRCNNRKGIDHDQYVGRGGRADEVIAALKERRMKRWRNPT